MKKTISYLAIVSCFTLGASLAHADFHGQGRDMHDGAMHEKGMCGQKEGKMLKEMDANSDGAISKAEFDAFNAKRFKAMDANGDGKISHNEIKPEHQKTLEKGKGKRFDEADANHDGALTLEEAETMPMLSKRFDKMDANHDGKLTREEMDSEMEKMAVALR